MITVNRLRPDDRAAWGELAAGYKAFYNTPTSPAEYDEAWRRLQQGDGVWAFGAHADGRLVGIVHYLWHTSTWARTQCYLQDLFTDPALRGRGVARALYDQVAVFKGFIRYDHPV